MGAGIVDRPPPPLFPCYGRFTSRTSTQLGLGNLDKNRSSWHKIKVSRTTSSFRSRPRSPSRSRMSMCRRATTACRCAGFTLYTTASRSCPRRRYKPRLAGTSGSATSSARQRTFASRISRTRSTSERSTAGGAREVGPEAPCRRPSGQLDVGGGGHRAARVPALRRGGDLEWNKASRKGGFGTPSAFRCRTSGRFRPRRINYCTFRWITNAVQPFAMSGLRAHRSTGEMIDGDVIFDASWIAPEGGVRGSSSARRSPGRIASTRAARCGRIVSTIMASKHGYGLPFPLCRTSAGRTTARARPERWTCRGGSLELDAVGRCC